MGADRVLSYAPPPTTVSAGTGAAYIVARIYAVISAGLVAVAWIVGMLLEDTFADAPGPSGSIERFGMLAGVLAASFLILIPNRWTVRTPYYPVRMSLLMLLSVYMLWLAVDGLVSYLRGGHSWEIIPMSLLTALLAVAAPLGLWMRRRWAGRLPI